MAVDPDQRMIDAFRQHRPEDTAVPAVVSNSTEPLTVTFFDQPAVNSVDPSFTKNQIEKAGRRVVGTQSFQPVSLASLFETYYPDRTVDFLNVDVEGHDLQVLESGDWNRFRPKVVAVESGGYEEAILHSNKVCAFMTANRYRMAAHCFITSIFVARDKSMK